VNILAMHGPMNVKSIIPVKYYWKLNFHERFHEKILKILNFLKIRSIRAEFHDET